VRFFQSGVAQQADRQQWGDLDADGRVSFAELALSTLYLVGALFVGLVLLAVGIGGLVGVRGGDVLRFLVRWWVWVSVIVSTVAGVALSVWRSLRYERDERVRSVERSRRWSFEDADREWMNGVAGRERGTRFGQGDVDAAAVLYLRRYYAGRGLSRQAWVKDGLSKDLWDHVNALMQKRGIRRGRKSELVPGSFADAWSVYLDGKVKSRQWLVSGADLLERS